MTNKRLIPCLYLESGRAVTGFGQRNLFGDGERRSSGRLLQR